MFESISSNFSNMIGGTYAQSFLLAQEATDNADQIVPFISNGWLAFITLIAIVALSIFIGRMIASSIRLPEYGSKLALILWCILTAVLMIAANGFQPKFGIDLRGGINMIGSLNLDAIGSIDNSFGSRQTTAIDIIPNLIRRVDPSGTQEIQIRPLGTDKIEVTIPTESKAYADEVWARLVKTGKLQFLIVAESRFSKHTEARQIATEMARQGNLSKRVGSVPKTIDGVEREMPMAIWFSLAKEDDEGQKIIPYKVLPSQTMLLRDSGSGQLVDASTIPIKSNDEDLARVEFTQWWQDNFQGSPQVLLMEPDDESMRVTGEDLDASQLTIGMDERGRDSINFGLNADGSDRMFNFTWEHKPQPNEGKFLMAIVLDDQAHTWPQLNDTIQRSGRITGNFTRKEVDDLIISLRSGNIDVALNDNPISQTFIESDLGQELKEKGLFAIGVSFVIVLLFMIFYYRFAGIVAALALLLNLLFILALVMAIQQPLTLTGLAGLVLTVGMSVDANVLIFERIREELDKGAALRMAIRNGFDKATTTIVDANVTTLITAIVLYVIGTEQIKGFAVTLILGILMSMFTAIYCSRAAFDIFERKRWISRLGMIRMLSKSEYNFINKRFVAGLLSVCLIGVGIAAMFGLQDKILHHDLRGGSTVRVVFQEPDTRDKVEEALKASDAKLEDGEAAEFSVASVSGRLADSDEFKDRIFKIDSNIPSYDGEGEASYEELADVISRVFDGKLELLNVEIGEPSIIGEDGPASGDTGMSWLNAPNVMAAMNLTRPSVILNSIQDDETETAKTDESDSLTTDQEIAESEQPDTADQGTASVEAEAPTSTNSNSFPAQGETPENESKEPTNYKIPKVSTPLKFKFPVSGKSVKNFVVTAAEKAGFELIKEQVSLNAPGMTPDDSVNSFMSNEWDVEANLSGTADAEKMFSAFAESFNTQPYFPTTSSVGGQIARATQVQALVAIIASLLGIIAYVWIRFQNVAFGLAAVVALIHDVLVVLGAIAISHYIADSVGFVSYLGIENFKISLPIVAALLTIIGYSLNDTIVVFDRIREVRGKRPELNAEIINTSISQTLSRTILTSLTTFIVVFILYCFGGDAIHGFAFSLVVGVIAGTYSSIFVASPVLLWLMNSVGLNPGDPIVADTETA